MPAKKRAENTVNCPHCGHPQREAVTAYSTVCKNCRRHYRLADVLNPRNEDTGPKPPVRQIVCFNCATPLQVPQAASSTMCKRCSSHIDLQDYTITSTVSKNFRTTGNFVIEEKGYVLNSDTIANEVILKGRFIGKLKAARLTIYNTAQIKGTFHTEHLIIPPGNQFRWTDPVTADTTEVQGELVADVHATKSLILRAGSRFFGTAKTPSLIVENGAVLVASVQTGAIRHAPAANPEPEPAEPTPVAPTPATAPKSSQPSSPKPRARKPTAATRARKPKSPAKSAETRTKT